MKVYLLLAVIFGLFSVSCQHSARTKVPKEAPISQEKTDSLKCPHCGVCQAQDKHHNQGCDKNCPKKDCPCCQKDHHKCKVCQKDHAHKKACNKCKSCQKSKCDKKACDGKNGKSCKKAQCHKKACKKCKSCQKGCQKSKCHKGCKKCDHHRHHGKKDSKMEGFASLAPVGEGKASGWVRFHRTFLEGEGKAIKISAQISGLSPGKKHGFHIHQYGDCSQDGKNAGSHFNPYENSHGGPSSKEKHSGDLGNLTADSKGVAVYEQTLKGCLKKWIGRAVIVHAGEDDLKTQPTGNAGPYIGCGVIGRSSSEKSAAAGAGAANKK